MIRPFTIHAGTHKTASTYIQSRLWRNREILSKYGIRLLYPENAKTGQFVDFADWIRERNFSEIKNQLSKVSTQDQHIIVSAEQFTKSLTDKTRVEELEIFLQSQGFKLNIAIFLRDQPDYINSIYVQEVRRFYHSQNIPEFERKCRKKRANRFNYYQMFSHLVDNQQITTNFLPYCTSLGDPFNRLLGSLGENLPEEIEWISEKPGKSNDQPGIKGVWLALEVCRRMQQMGVKLKLLKNQSNYIRKYSIPLGWSENRYYGLRQKKVEIIRNFYKNDNDSFAQKVWGKKSWAEVYKDLPQQKYNVLDESLLTTEELNEMKDLIEQILTDLREENSHAFPMQ